MTIISIQSTKTSSIKAREFLSSKKALLYFNTPSKNSNKAIKIFGYGEDFYAEWNIEDKILVVIGLEKSTNQSIMSLVIHYRLPALKNSGYFNHAIIEVGHERVRLAQAESLKLILKNSKNPDKPTFKQCSVVENQSDKFNCLVIHETYSNYKWVIVSFSMNYGTAFCYANLNNKENAEFGDVRFADISEMFGLASGFDDNNIITKLVSSKEILTDELIMKM